MEKWTTLYRIWHPSLRAWMLIQKSDAGNTRTVLAER